MEDPDPQLRESLKEMLFDNKKFKWDRLEDLLSNAAKQTDLDLEKLLDEVINLLFSPNGGFLRNEIIEGITNQIDSLSWKIFQSVNFYLPKSLKVNINHKNNKIDNLIFNIEPIKKFIKVLENIPGYSIDIFLTRLPRLFNDPYTKEMSIKIAKNLTEKNVVRIVKIAAGAKV
tara:strand:- start:1715 stop:2233 length:519 start_codon:yes stop_codon:yes gene_type:complete